MDKKEFAMFAAMIQTFYPKDNVLPTDQAMEMWYEVLKDIPFNVAQAFLNKWSMTNKWSPTIADIRQGTVSITTEEIPDWGKGWDEVQKAIRYYGMYRPEEAMASLSPITKDVTKRLGFLNLCTSENMDADRANFRMIYEELAKRKKEDACLPEGLKTAIENIRQKSLETKTVNGIEDKSIGD